MQRGPGRSGVPRAGAMTSCNGASARWYWVPTSSRARPARVSHHQSPAVAGRTSTELPTEAGLPIFDDDNDDVSWFSARAETPPPPPAFDDPPERPLFAPEPTEGPARRPRHPVPAGAGPSGATYWPWDTGAGPGTGTGSTSVVDEPDEERHS